jgi:ribosomal protein L11 methyltransferase
MEFEITIQGPRTAVGALLPRLKGTSVPMDVTHGGNDLEQGEVKIVVVLSGEDRLNAVLSSFSLLISEMDREPHLTDQLHMRVRNLAYSEPPSGSDRFLDPFQPIPSLIVQPWSPALKTQVNAHTVLLDPQHAFGTGKHPTTRLCLQAIHTLAREDARSRKFHLWNVLDFGCGTALLAIAAVKLGARSAVGVEIDSDAVRTARSNALLNGLSDRIDIKQGSWESVHGRYDLILANLVLSSLLRVGTRIPDYLAEHGLTVVSGFGINQIPDVKARLSDVGLTTCRQLTSDGWGVLVLTKKKDINVLA